MGQPPCLDSNQGDFFFLCRRSPDRLVQTVVELCRDRLPKSMGVEPGQIQVLSATRRGECGTVSLNRALQAALNPPARDKRQKLWGDMVFRVGDRIMQTKNNYDVLWTKDDGAVGSGIFNGDVGVIEDIDPAGELLTNARQADAVSRALSAVTEARSALRIGITPDVVLTDCEAALEALGELNGKRIREDLVDTIFSRFCVGK